MQNEASKKIEIGKPYDPSIVLLGINIEDGKSVGQRDFCF